MVKPGKRSVGWERLMFKKLEGVLGDRFLDEIDEDVIDAYRTAVHGSR